jgi:hypothetical protein
MKKILKIILFLIGLGLIIWLVVSFGDAEPAMSPEEEIEGAQEEIIQEVSQNYFTWNVDVMGIVLDIPEVYKPEEPYANAKLVHYAPEEDYFAFNFFDRFRHDNGKDLITLRVNNHSFSSMGEDPPYDDTLGDQVMTNKNGVKYSLKLFKACDYQGVSCQYYDHYKIKLHEDAYSNTITLSVWKGQNNDGGYADLDIEKVLDSIKVFEPIVTEDNVNEITQEV